MPAFGEIDAPITKQLDVNVSGRYDHYSEGFSHFSPKVGVKFTPIREFALRGTYSKGFRAPTFAESGPRSQFAGCSTFNPPAGFVAAHGGATNPYATSYSLCAGLNGNPNLKPELSRSFTAGIIAQPVRWFSLTADYYNVKKTNVIVAGPLANAAKAAYYTGATAAAGCAAVAAVGPGYSCNTVDAVDPLFPNALPRVLIINQPFVNSAEQATSGLDISATANFRFAPGVRFTSRVEVTDVFKYDLTPGAGAAVQHFVGTMGPYELSSGAGTPKWRGNWQNSLDVGKFSSPARPITSDGSSRLQPTKSRRTPITTLIYPAPTTCTAPATTSAMPRRSSMSISMRSSGSPTTSLSMATSATCSMRTLRSCPNPTRA